MERSGRSRRRVRCGKAGCGLMDRTHHSGDGHDAGKRAQRNRPHRLDGAERRGMIVAARCRRAAEVGARALRVMAGWRRCGTGLMRVARRGALVEHDRQAHQQRGECRGRGAARRSNHASILTHLTLLQLHRQRSANPTVRASAGSPSAASIRRSPSSSACIVPQGFRVKGSCRPTSIPRCAPWLIASGLERRYVARDRPLVIALDTFHRPVVIGGGESQVEREEQPAAARAAGQVDRRGGGRFVVSMLLLHDRQPNRASMQAAVPKKTPPVGGGSAALVRGQLPRLTRG